MWYLQADTLVFLLGAALVYALAAYIGAVESLELVWNLSDIFNALMALPNMVCLLLLSGTAARELRAFQPVIRRERRKVPRRRR